MGHIERDDRVRISRQVAKGLMARQHRRTPSKRIDWLGRQGTVVRTSRTTDNVWVLWDDRAAVDPWPFRALEKL